jgi:hypothetical protein
MEVGIHKRNDRCCERCCLIELTSYNNGPISALPASQISSRFISVSIMP